MKILNHLLYTDDGKQVSYRPTPNKAGKYTPSYLVMHYTAATKASGSIAWFLNPTAKASAHLVIDRDGTITQFAPFNIITWHAGVSQWNGLNGLNSYSIGIELVNGGKLAKQGGKWVCPVDKTTVSDDDVIIAKHKNETAENGWQEYSEKQLSVAIDVATLLVKTYQLKDVIGHEDIAPFRKTDPGPAFPMTSFKAKAMGRKDATLDLYKTSTQVNIRKGAGTQFETITDMLPANTKVTVFKREGTWSFVEVLDTVHGLNDIEGWVSSKYLVK
ncbi:N-acetylmuramoyl-L-alanine amidase [Arcicella aquatica]|uniref:N-acetylmuramoyl-L-alanine amidase n=1 Tax=Arcicella aquatica TaxID=217141 RepID=A0ABU5QUM6_9BACT|nr:N-acetylmuramoyl-L-alanine amidase [Arcicella aquatica]MEA5260410.1 N-acetylmuramoyl-L-alanine amidase [Arcicella aquatica]